MGTVTQTVVPRNALASATRDPRALLAIPETRAHVYCLACGRRVPGPYCPETLRPSVLASRATLKAAKALLTDRDARRDARQVAEQARLGPRPGRYTEQADARRLARVSAVLSDLLDQHYRCAASSWAGGDTYNTITFGAPAARATADRVWSRNGKWSGHDCRRSVTVPTDWITAVHARGLAVCDGLVTLDARPLPAPTGTELYAAVWVRQGRGMEIRAERGWIARDVPTGTTYHGTTTDRATLTGLRRKLTAQGVPPEVRDARRAESARKRAERAAAQISRLVDRVRRHDLGALAGVEITPADSLRAGNCRPGTEEFAARYFPSRASVTIGELARALADRPAAVDITLARQVAAACLVAIRRDRNARRVLALA